MLDFNLEEIKTKVLSKNRKEPINPEGLSISSLYFKDLDRFQIRQKVDWLIYYCN